MAKRALLGLLVLLALAPDLKAERGAPFQPSTDLDAVLVEAARTRQPVVAVFGAGWCPHCRRLRHDVLPSHEVAAAGADLLWAEIDVDRAPDLARRYAIDAVPTLLLIGPDGAVRQRIVGLIGAEDLAARLRRFHLELAEPGGPQPPTAEPAVYPSTALVSTPSGFRARSICFSNVGYGPLALASQSPFQSLRFGITPTTPSTLTRGETQLRLTGTWANVWAYDETRGTYLLDYETLHGEASLAYGVSDTFQLGLQVEARTLFGGILDGLIQSFHDLVGIGQGGRDLFPRDQIHIELDPGGGRPKTVLGNEAAGVYARNLVLTAQHNISCGTAVLPALSWSVSLRHEIGQVRGLEGGGGTDVAFAVASSRRWGEWYGYLTLASTWFGRHEVYGIPLTTHQLSLLAAAEWRYRPRTSAVVQLLATQGVAKDFGPFSDPSWEITLGWKSEVATGTVLELGLIENIITFDNSPDFGIHAGVTTRF